MVDIYLHWLIESSNLKIIINIMRQRRLQSLIKSTEYFSGSLVFYNPEVDMCMSNIWNSIFVSITNISSENSCYLNRWFQSYLSKEIHILVIENRFDSKVSHDFFFIHLYSFVFDQNFRLHLFDIIVKIWDSDFIVHIIEFAKNFIHFMDSIGYNPTIQS